MLIFRRAIVLTQHLVSLWVTVQYTGYERTLVACGLNSHLNTVTIPDAVLIQMSS